MAVDRDELFLSIAHEIPHLREEQRYEEAIQWLNSLIAENTSDHELTVTARMGISTCLMELNRYEEAERLMNALSDEVLTRDQTFLIQKARAALLEQTRRHEACLDLCNKLLLNPMAAEEAYEEGRAELLACAGFSQTWLGLYSDALQDLSDSLSGIGTGRWRDSILLYLAVCFRALGQPKEALARVEEGLTTGTGLLKGNFAYQQGLALKESGRKLEAQAAFLRAYADADVGNTSREDILLEMEGAGKPS